MQNTIRNYRNKVMLHFERSGENFTLDVPHYRTWLSIIRFLKRRGFKVGENETYKQDYKVLSKYHKIGFKKEVALLAEIGANSITVEFGNIQNLWENQTMAFWDNPNDDRFTKLNYLQGVAVKLEIKKLIDFCKRFDLKLITEDEDLSPEDFIIKGLRLNKHVHGNVECLNDIKLSITPDSYNWKHNSNDKDKKKITCGELKYFYDSRTRRLSCGIVWHNINNMWWVIFGGRLRNVSSYELFDLKEGMPRRKLADKGYIEGLLKKNEAKRDYRRCMNIQEHYKHILLAS